MAHRRSGKTVACVNHLIRSALQVQRSKYAFVAPTYKQGKNVAWDYLKYYSRVIPDIKINESELRVDFPTGSRIQIYGADNPDSLRGLGLWGVVFDEYSQQPSNIFSEIIRPALADHEGYAIWIGTPKGRNEFYDLYDKAEGKEDWFRTLLTVEDTDALPIKEIEEARLSMTEDEFEQEFMCSFDTSLKGAIYATELREAKKAGRVASVPLDEALNVHTVWDLGMHDATAIGFFQKVAGEMRMIDYYEEADQAFPHFKKVLEGKGYRYGKHFAPHDIKVRELSSGRSRWELARGFGIVFDMIPNIAVWDGIGAARLLLKRLWIDKERCGQFVDLVAQYSKEWDENRGMYRAKPKHDFTSHAADVLRYAALVEDKMSYANVVKQFRPNVSIYR